MEYDRPGGNDKLEGRVRKFAACLRCDFAEEIARDPGAFKKQVVRLLRHELPPARGRPLSEPVTCATEMRAKAQPWLAIYRQCIPGYGGLAPWRPPACGIAAAYRRPKSPQQEKENAP